ncbi:hypothetical protein [Cyclobacterium jeungdonense]|uniref:Uncharacterized protein n=1 Tax=Cyclobacterium jeungdonense TaxID=708087 RepID=A0ABT8CBF7_9BACT|nr:hypothetical protein [Cyclobacterium jeungdonense]MDN3690124.1 hypothetical protein [Cyclobacterium jeungdonense]
MDRTLVKIDYTLKEQKLAQYAKSLGHPVSIQILKILIDKPCSLF